MAFLLWIVAFLVVNSTNLLRAEEISTENTTGETRLLGDGKSSELPIIPTKIPPPSADGIIYINNAQGVPMATTIIPWLQNHLSSFLIDARSPIAAVVVADAKNGNILAMAQGRAPELWGGKVHTALHGGFPAASIFKTVVTAAAFELASWDPFVADELLGGCSRVGESGHWLMGNRLSMIEAGQKAPIRSASEMSLRRAFAHSCNGYYAKIAVNDLGIGAINHFAKKFGWTLPLLTDFAAEKPPFRPPNPQSSSAHTVGKFAAGFGNVGLSAVHGAAMMLTIANRGQPMALRLFQDGLTKTGFTGQENKTNEIPKASPLEGGLPIGVTEKPSPPVSNLAQIPPMAPIYSQETADQLLGILDSSVLSGTASFAFRRGKYQKIRGLVGGKTGTLTGSSPPGLTTWFTGLAPVDDPEVVVSAVVILDGRWIVKGPSLAAEAFSSYFDYTKMTQDESTQGVIAANKIKQQDPKPGESRVKKSRKTF